MPALGGTNTDLDQATAPKADLALSISLVRSFSDEDTSDRRIKINSGEITEITTWDLNNFFTNVIGDSSRKLFEDSRYGLDIDELNSVAYASYSPSELHVRSEKFLSQSQGQFFEAIDSAIIQEGLELNYILELNKQYGQSCETENWDKARELINKFNIVLLPVYLRLRQSGYYHDELIV